MSVPSERAMNEAHRYAESDGGHSFSSTEREVRTNSYQPHENHRRRNECAASILPTHLQHNDPDDLELERHDMHHDERATVTNILPASNWLPSGHDASQQRELQASRKGKGRTMVIPDPSEPTCISNVTASTQGATGPLPPASSHALSAQQPDVRDLIDPNPSQHLVSSVCNDRDSDLPFSGNSRAVDRSKQEISEESNIITSKANSRASKYMRSRNPLLLAQAHLFQANNDARNRGVSHIEPRLTGLLDMDVDRPSLLKRFSSSFKADASTVQDVTELGAFATESVMTPSSSEQYPRIDEDVAHPQEKGQEGLQQNFQQRDSSAPSSLLERNLRAKVLHRLKNEKDPQTTAQASPSVAIRSHTSPSLATVDGSEGGKKLEDVEAKLRLRARLRSRLASEKRLSENVNRNCQ